ncbi:alpha/beta hydrolase [Sneathiella sp.]|uniref:alpha/beta hydrolase n=1 Tax=Sneathiella sp. TaxID=1964365 RepID=UPI002606716D|nr:alpha/beta hydrolase [Sneathiella sp.]MDF2367823.1 lysophospholipase [Sneathiella sp.]
MNYFDRLFRQFTPWAMALFFLAACSPVVQQAGPETTPAELTDRYLQTRDGEKLPVKIWAAEEPAAIIIAVHGFNDYNNTYAFPGSWWIGEELTTIAYDQRGFGEAPNFGIWPGQELMIQDLATMVEETRATYPGKPIYLLGESMGGAVLITAVTSDDFPEVDGIILSAPAVWGWQALNPFYQAVLWTAAHTVPEVKMTGQGLGIRASDNISMLRNLSADPLFIKETRIDSVYGLVNIMDAAYDAVKDIKLPTLLLYGENDQLVPKEPIEKIAAELAPGSDIVLYENGWHMLMRDLQGPVVWRDIAEWIKKREIPSGKKIASLPLFKDE